MYCFCCCCSAAISAISDDVDVPAVIAAADTDVSDHRSCRFQVVRPRPSGAAESEVGLMESIRSQRTLMVRGLGLTVGYVVDILKLFFTVGFTVGFAAVFHSRFCSCFDSKFCCRVYSSRLYSRAYSRSCSRAYCRLQ